MWLKTTNRLAALGLLLLLPAVTAARFTLDLAAVPDPQGRIETEHHDGCPPPHSHVFCTLLARSPPSLPQGEPRILQTLPAVLAQPVVDEVLHGRHASKAVHARSPPSTD